MKYIVFIESIKDNEWEVGAIIHNEITHNPDYKDIQSCIIQVRNDIELKKVLSNLSATIIKEDDVIIQIDAHSNENELSFRNDSYQDDSYNTLTWDDVVNMCDSIFGKYNDRVLFIFASCLSALYFKKKQPSPVFCVIAAENIVAPRRMEEQLLVFYKSFCSGNSFEQAYNEMIQRFPIDEELRRDEKKQSVLRFYK
jgi:hypothetical protein